MDAFSFLIWARLAIHRLCIQNTGSSASADETVLIESGLKDTESTVDRRVAATLRSMIVEGSIQAGEKVTEVGVAKLLDVSRTPARLALPPATVLRVSLILTIAFV